MMDTPKKPDQELPASNELVKKASMREIFEELELVFTRYEVLARNVKMYLCQRYSGKKLKEIGFDFPIGESGVSQTCRRIDEQMEKDKKLKRRIVGLEERINLSRLKTPIFSQR
jgi:REP-associated tyrosine transposase